MFDQKYPNKAFLIPDLGMFYFLQNFEYNKFEGTHFK